MVMSILKKAALWCMGVVAVLVATLYIINSQDETLSPQTISLLKAPPNPYSRSDNLYLMLSELNRPSETSAIAAGGQKPVRPSEAALPKEPKGSHRTPDKRVLNALVFKGKVLGGSWLPMATLWHRVASYKPQIDRLLVANRVLYRRYLALHHATGFYDTATLSDFEGPPHPPRQLRQLFLADFALRMQSRDAAQHSAALTDMEEDLKVWKTVLKGYGSLSSKMLAASYLRQDFLLIGNMIADPSVVLSAPRAAINRLVALFPISDWKIGSTFAYEYRRLNHDLVMGLKSDRQMEGMQPLWDRVGYMLLAPFFIKKRATENLQTTNTLRAIAIFDGPPRALGKAVTAYVNKAPCLVPDNIHCLYNPIGKRTIAVAIPSLFVDLQFALQAYDTAALQRMVRLAYEIRVDRIPTADIAHFMKQHPQWSTHPGDGRAFVFKRAKRQLSVERLAYLQKTRKYFTIPIWTARSHESQQPHRKAPARPLQRRAEANFHG